MVDVSKPSNAFGAFVNQAFEEISRENLLEARQAGGCDFCVDVGHVPLCGHRAWGGEERPRPDGPNMIVADEVWPWICTREPEHDGRHVACRMNDHHVIAWAHEESVRSAQALSVTVTKMLEMNDYPIPGKFVRRPRLDLISQPGDITILPVMGVHPNLNGTWRLRVLTPWHECHSMEIDCPQEIYETLPSTRFCEGDIMCRSKQKDIIEGASTIRGIASDPHNMSQDFYLSATEVAETLSELHPIENDNLREFFGELVAAITLYEERHGMVTY